MNKGLRRSNAISVFPDYTSGRTLSQNVVYQADVDGWLSVVMVGSWTNGMAILVGSTSNPTTIIAQQGDDLGSYTKTASFMVPISSGTYYKIANPYWTGGVFESVTILFFPVKD